MLVPAVPARLLPARRDGWTRGGRGHTVATVNIWLCMSFAGAECTLTATVLARRRINPATCSRERWIMTFYRNDICAALIWQKPPSRLGARRGAIRFGPRMVTMLGVLIGSRYSLGQNAIPLDIFSQFPNLCLRWKVEKFNNTTKNFQSVNIQLIRESLELVLRKCVHKSVQCYIIHTILVTVIYFWLYLDLFIALEYNFIFQVCGVFSYYLLF